MTYRLERVTDYKINGVRDVILICESKEFNEVQKKFMSLISLPHFGYYQIIREDIIDSERTQKHSVKDNKV